MFKDCSGKHSLKIICPILKSDISVKNALQGNSDDKLLELFRTEMFKIGLKQLEIVILRRKSGLRSDLLNHYTYNAFLLGP
jgi:hypothetical protein